MRFLPYTTGKYANADAVDFIDTTITPPTITINGVSVGVDAQYRSIWIAAIKQANPDIPPSRPETLPQPGVPPQ